MLRIKNWSCCGNTQINRGYGWNGGKTRSCNRSYNRFDTAILHLLVNSRLESINEIWNFAVQNLPFFGFGGLNLNLFSEREGGWFSILSRWQLSHNLINHLRDVLAGIYSNIERSQRRQKIPTLKMPIENIGLFIGFIIILSPPLVQ